MSLFQYKIKLKHISICSTCMTMFVWDDIGSIWEVIEKIGEVYEDLWEVFNIISENYHHIRNVSEVGSVSGSAWKNP